MDKTKRKTILLIDDDSIALVVASVMLSEDYEVTTAKSGKEALFLLLHDFKPDLILLDILMPEMDGWETFHAIKGIVLLQNIPIIFLSSVSDEEGIKQSQVIGVSDYITKPYDKANLLSRVKNVLSQSPPT